MAVDHVFEDHVKPYILNRFHDADLVLLCGSQARFMTQACGAEAATAPKKNSDYDFILLYSGLPEKYPAAMFASGWIDVPGRDEPVSIDMKIMDFDYLAYHAKHTFEVRRFPFLFTMLIDAYPIQDMNGVLPSLQREAADLLARGPAPLGQIQINEMRGQLDKVSQSLRQNHTNYGQKIVAAEALQVLANTYLRANMTWDSPLDRHLVSLCQAHPSAGLRLARAFNDASAGNFAGYHGFIEITRDILNNRETDMAPDSALFAQNINNFVTPAEKTSSDHNSVKIMTGQYIARLKDADAYDIIRRDGLNSILWLTLKKHQCEQMNVAFTYGEDSVVKADAAFGRPILRALFSAIADGHTYKMAGLADTILANQGGLKFDYLERIYVEDLARRREGVNQNMPVIATPRVNFFKYG